MFNLDKVVCENCELKPYKLQLICNKHENNCDYFGYSSSAMDYPNIIALPMVMTIILQFDWWRAHMGRLVMRPLAPPLEITMATTDIIATWESCNQMSDKNGYYLLNI